MKRNSSLSLIVVFLAAIWIPMAPVDVQTQDKPVQLPNPACPRS